MDICVTLQLIWRSESFKSGVQDRYEGSFGLLKLTSVRPVSQLPQAKSNKAIGIVEISLPCASMATSSFSLKPNGLTYWCNWLSSNDPWYDGCCKCEYWEYSLACFIWPAKSETAEKDTLLTRITSWLLFFGSEKTSKSLVVRQVLPFNYCIRIHPGHGHWAWVNGESACQPVPAPPSSSPVIIICLFSSSPLNTSSLVTSTPVHFTSRFTHWPRAFASPISFSQCNGLLWWFKF